MITLTDIDVLRMVAEDYAERYNRRCRRLVALYTNGRTVDDNMILYKTDMRRLGYETTKKDLEDAMELAMTTASFRE